MEFTTEIKKMKHLFLSFKTWRQKQLQSQRTEVKRLELQLGRLNQAGNCYANRRPQQFDKSFSLSSQRTI